MNAFANLSTAKKLIAAFLLVSAITAGVGYLGAAGVIRVGGMLENLYQRDLTAFASLTAARAANWAAGVSLRNTMLHATAAQIEEDQHKMEAAAADFEENLSQAERLLGSDDNRAALAEVRTLWTAYLAGAREVAALAGKNERAKAVATWRASAALGIGSVQMREKLGLLVDAQRASAKARHAESVQSVARIAWELIGSVVLSVLAALLLGWFFARLISRPLIASVAVLRQISAGDFTVTLDVHSRDEVGQMASALNDAVGNIRQALSAVSRVSGDVASAASQLTQSSLEIASGTQTAAASLEETAASLEEITATVKQNADSAAQADGLAASSREVAEKGGRVVDGTIEAMKGIGEASKRIADIITTIDEIAFQTNLLALNAAVEAARAGDQGRGFAVVASEVRNLAQRSAGAAKEIKGLIQETIRKVDEGQSQVNQSGAALREIVLSVKRVTEVIGEIAAGSREQSTGINQVNAAVAQVDQVTQANAAQTEELSATAEELSGQATELQRLVQTFRIEEAGKRKPSSAPAAKKAPAKAPMRIQGRTVPKKAAAGLRPGAREEAGAALDDGHLNGKALELDGFSEF